MPLAFSIAASWTSSRNPASMSSLPDAQSATCVVTSTERKAPAAAALSGDNEPSRPAMIAPAPTRSSTAGRSLPSGQCSPAAITLTRRPSVPAASAIAAALRRHPAITGNPSLSACSAIVAPLGDGKTIRTPASTHENDAGDNEYGFRADMSDRGTANSASIELAKSAASPLSQGKMSAPREVAMSTAVEKDNTSTTITTSESAPDSPTRRSPIPTGCRMRLDRARSMTSCSSSRPPALPGRRRVDPTLVRRPPEPRRRGT